MAAQYNNRVDYFGDTLIDISGDTVTAADVLNGKTFHDASGAPRTGTAVGMNAQAKNVTPSMSQQTVTPDSGYNCLSQVTVAAVPVSYAENAGGGNTVTIG